MKKTYLLTPGPTQIPESILASSAKPIIHHRTPEFMKLMEEVRNGLKYLYQTKEDVLLLTSSGTGAMDAAITNLFSTGDKVIVLNAGKFGERFVKISKAYGLNVIEIKVDAGKSISASEVSKTLSSHSDARAVLFQASDTSTGVKMPVKEICEVVSQLPNCITVVDAITALGVVELPMDAWKIDVLITGSQKALMIPPGLAFIALSQKAWGMNSKSNLPKFYFNLKKESELLQKNQTSWTPAIGLILNLAESLKMIQEEKLENVHKRHSLLARATRNAIKALGLELLTPDSPSEAVTAVKVPSEITDGKKIIKTLSDKYGVTIVGGQDELEGKIFRLTHIGFVDKFDILVGIGALELTLQDLGYKKFKLGAGSTAVLETFAAQA